MNCTHRR